MGAHVIFNALTNLLFKVGLLMFFFVAMLHAAYIMGGGSKDEEMRRVSKIAGNMIPKMTGISIITLVVAMIFVLLFK